MCDQGSSVGLCKCARTQDYKSLCASVTSCAIMVNTQTHTPTDRQQAYWPAYMNSSTSWAEKKLPLQHDHTMVYSCAVSGGRWWWIRRRRRTTDGWRSSRWQCCIICSSSSPGLCSGSSENEAWSPGSCSTTRATLSISSTCSCNYAQVCCAYARITIYTWKCALVCQQTSFLIDCIVLKECGEFEDVQKKIIVTFLDFNL